MMNLQPGRQIGKYVLQSFIGEGGMGEVWLARKLADDGKAYAIKMIRDSLRRDPEFARRFRAEAEKRGYIVVGVAAPDGDLFFEEGARIFPDFLKMILADYKIQDGKFHIAGPSNGGIAAFHVAAANPQYFISVTAFPGYMWEPSNAKLLAISKMCVFMYVGENDEYRWHDEMKQEAEFLRSKGAVARYSVEKGQPHRLETLAGPSASRLFDNFEETKKGCSK